MEPLKQAFDDLALRFDDQRRHVIFCMDEFYEAATWAAWYDGDDPRILDIGAGTGLFTARLLKRYPRARVTLLDISDPMLDIARQRFSGQKDVTYITGDFSLSGLPRGFDLVVSALSIHHLDDDRKRSLYARVYDALRPGGVFVNADQVRAKSPWLEERYRNSWDEFLHAGPLPVGEREAIRNRRDTFDKNGDLDDQLAWLSGCGFTDVDVVYKNRMFAVMTGRKPE